jgi:hypothetical protein
LWVLWRRSRCRRRSSSSSSRGISEEKRNKHRGGEEADAEKKQVRKRKEAAGPYQIGRCNEVLAAPGRNPFSELVSETIEVVLMALLNLPGGVVMELLLSSHALVWFACRGVALRS